MVETNLNNTKHVPEYNKVVKQQIAGKTADTAYSVLKVEKTKRKKKSRKKAQHEYMSKLSKHKAQSALTLYGPKKYGSLR